MSNKKSLTEFITVTTGFCLIILWAGFGLAQTLESIPPSNPDVDAVPGDGFVKIYWNSTPENDVDSVLKKLYPQTPAKWNNFEGYKIYRATDYQFEGIHTITDGHGVKRYYKPLVQFDRLNGIEDHFKGNSGLGIPLVFTNTSDNSFDNALPPFYPDIRPMQQDDNLFQESSNGTWRLSITDIDTSKNIGQLVNWKIAFKASHEDTFIHQFKGTISDLNVIENPGFDQFTGGDQSNPVMWKRYQPESMFFQGVNKTSAPGRQLKVKASNFWDVSTKNRIQNGDFEEVSDTTDWEKIYDHQALNLDWITAYAADSTGWLKLDIKTDSIAGINWSLPASFRIEAPDWSAYQVKVAGENIPQGAILYLGLNEGTEKTVRLGNLPTDTVRFNYYRQLGSDLTDVSLYVKNAQDATVYINRIKASTAELLTQEVYQRLPRVVPGADYTWQTKIFDNDPSIEITPGYRAYLPNQEINEYTQHGWEHTEDDSIYQYFSRSFSAPENLQDGIFYYKLSVNANAWQDTAVFYLDSLTMTGNSKWGLNLYPQVNSAITVNNAPSNWNDFQVILDIAHPWLYELKIDLTGPSSQKYSLMNGVYARSFLDGTYGIAQYLGDESGLQYTYTDTSVSNGQRYFYAVVAYDHGDSLYNILPIEGNKLIRIENDAYVFAENTTMVIPNPYAKGYTPPSINDAGITHQGPSTGSISLDVVDSRKVKNDMQYEVYFYDTSNDPHYTPNSTLEYFLNKTTAYGIRNTVNNDTLVKYNRNISQPSPVFNGLRIQLDNPEQIEVRRDSIRWQGSQLSHPEISTDISDLGGNRYPCKYKLTFSDTTADTAIAYQHGFVKLKSRPVDFSMVNLLYNKPVKFAYRPVSGKDDFIIYPLFADTLDTSGNPVNFPYKSGWYIKLLFDGDNLIANQSADKGGLFFWQDADSTVSYQRVTGFGNIPLFKTGDATILFWEIGAAPSSSNPKFVSLGTDSLVNPGLYYFKGWLKATAPQTVHFGTETKDTTFHVTESYSEFSIPIEISDTTQLGLTWESIGNDTLYVYDIAFNEKYRYQKGDYLIFSTTVQFQHQDTYQFTTQAAGEQLTAEDNWENFTVVPNPYILTASWDYEPNSPGSYSHKISFVNVPQDAQIRIFTVRGDLVTKLEHSSNIFNGTIDWNLTNEAGKNVAYGVYIYHIRSKKLGQKIGKFAIIR